jgi:hypothetical protein
MPNVELVPTIEAFTDRFKKEKGKRSLPRFRHVILQEGDHYYSYYRATYYSHVDDVIVTAETTNPRGDQMIQAKAGVVVVPGEWTPGDIEKVVMRV